MAFHSRFINFMWNCKIIHPNMASLPGVWKCYCGKAWLYDRRCLKCRRFICSCIDVMYRRNFYQAMGKSFSAEEIEKLFPPDKIKETCRYEVQNQMTVDFDDEEAENAVYAKISQLVSNSGDEMVLFYDYGDGWEVSITLEKIFEDKELPGRELPRVLEGNGYGIIEDCGGPGGLNKLAKAFKKKSGKQYREFCNWLGFEELDLTSFDVDDMNYRLKKVPRIYADAYELGLEPTKQSLNLLTRKYKK